MFFVFPGDNNTLSLKIALTFSSTEKANKNGRILFERVDEDYDQADYNPFEHRSVDHSNKYVIHFYL